ncbi:MAG: lipid II flippase MurJ [Acidimicrobiales bacterium]
MSPAGSGSATIGRGPPPSTSRSAAVILAGNVASRVTGFARVLSVAAALGTTYLGNTYQTSNLVSNVAFELLVAGLLSSVLVPTFVGLAEEGRDLEAERLAGALLGMVLVALGILTGVGIAAASLVMRALTVVVGDARVRQDEIRLGAFLLVFFLPQLLLYALGAVATALLHARRRFAAAAFAPVANNLVVIATMVAFTLVRHRDHGPLGLTLSTVERLVLAIGTTTGVLALIGVPVVALWRSGFRLRPRWAPRHPGLAALARPGAWAGGYLAINQMMVLTTLILANRVAGGVVAYQIAFTFFLLPNAMLAHPVFTALYPELASDAVAERSAEFRASLAGGTRTIGLLLLPAAAALVALSRPTLTLLEAGALDAAGASLVARVLGAYGIGLGGYALFQLFTRSHWALGDMRRPTLVVAFVAAGGSGLMLWWSSAARGGDQVVVLGLAHSVALVAGAVALGVLVGRRRRWERGVLTALSRSAVCAAAAGLAARAVADSVGAPDRAHAALAMVLGLVAGAAVYLAGLRAMRSVGR